MTVAGTTQELSATVGNEVNITCLFGEGTLRNIYWYFNSTLKILTLAKGVLNVEPPYIGRATLQNDNNTLSLKDLTIADEGSYRCDVDRQGQPAVLHIISDLKMFSLRPGTLPVVSPCTMIGESTHCTAQANDTFSLTCTLFNVYPVQDAVLTWYQDGKSVASSFGETLNSDVIANLSLRIEVTETRNLSCQATFVSVDGRQHTAVSVEALVIPLADDPDTPKEKIGGPAIIGIVGAVVFPMMLVIYCYKKRRYRNCPSFNTRRNNGNQRYVQVPTGATATTSAAMAPTTATVACTSTSPLITTTSNASTTSTSPSTPTNGNVTTTSPSSCTVTTASDASVSSSPTAIAVSVTSTPPSTATTDSVTSPSTATTASATSTSTSPSTATTASVTFTSTSPSTAPSTATTASVTSTSTPPSTATTDSVTSTSTSPSTATIDSVTSTSTSPSTATTDSVTSTSTSTSPPPADHVSGATHAEIKR
ncbi:uncharacterized protein DDB_G0271670-like [Lytechinus pictus]|uniref:uncharacterized protein DDB_G0271670-like n=1 Tax=Lytechinus pictus TaxID=7653 RepID=UPI0030BA2445